MSMCGAFPVHPPVEFDRSLEQRLYCKSVCCQDSCFGLHSQSTLMILVLQVYVSILQTLFLSFLRSRDAYALHCIGRSPRVDILGGTLSHTGQKVLA